MVLIHMAAPGYFKTMGIPVKRGRDFTERDTLSAPPVLIVNEALARQQFPNEDPIGKRMAPGFSTIPVRDDDSGMREIVGVVADVKHGSLQGAAQPEIYFAQSQMPMSAMTVVVRAAGDPRALQRSVRGVVQSLDANAPVYAVRTVEEVLNRSVATPRFNTVLLGLFAAVALILTMVGLYGVISCSVSENTQQIGIRVALGAQRSDVFKLIVGQGVILAIVRRGDRSRCGLRADAVDVEPAVRRGVHRPVDVQRRRGAAAVGGCGGVLSAGAAGDERRSNGRASMRIARLPDTGCASGCGGNSPAAAFVCGINGRSLAVASTESR